MKQCRGDSKRSLLRSSRILCFSTRRLVALRTGLLGSSLEKNLGGDRWRRVEGKKKKKKRKRGKRKKEQREKRCATQPHGAPKEALRPPRSSGHGGGVPETQVLVSKRAHGWRAMSARKGRRPEKTPAYYSEVGASGCSGWQQFSIPLSTQGCRLTTERPAVNGESKHP